MILGMVAGAALAQGTPLHPVAAFRLSESGLVLRRHVAAGEPFTVAGPQGVIVGEQQGSSEVWILPVKLLSHLTLEAEVEGYPVPIDLNAAAREIEVRPDRTTITYSHIAVTVRQTMFAADAMPEGTGAVAVFAVDAVRPVDLTLRFTGEMRNMWPMPGGGTPSAEWVQRGSSGFYVLHTDFPDFAGAVALPGATSGIMAPYQERPQVHPLELKLHVDPKTDRGKVWPLLMAVGRTKEAATNVSLEARLSEVNERLAGIYTAHVARYRAQAAELTSIRTPDAALDEDFGWAETSIGQLRAKAQPTGEMGLVAGYYESGDSARPGFGWFFGRDALYTVYAIDSYGDFGLARAELEFLMRRQRADGKVMHEWSQTAAYVDWKDLPYQFAAADATPLFLTTMLDYVRASGDVGFLAAHKDAVMRAWQFETSHDADGDGVYDNAQGTGWVESWPSTAEHQGMPKQEVYLALLDQQGSAAMGEMARLLKDEATARVASARAKMLRGIIEREYFLSAKDAYAFSQNLGKLDETATVFPSIAWWNSGEGYDPGLAHAGASLKRWASHDFATDWGARDVAESDPLYDPISYHQGSVWPLFTGWAAMAEYRGGQALAGYASLMQNADLTTAHDLGAVTELLSGAFFEPFGRSTSHQLWSSAMVVTPILRGLFGLEVDGVAGTVKVEPRLPADWDSAEVRRLHVGVSVVDVAYRREGAAMIVELKAVSGAPVRLVGSVNGRLRVGLPAVELSLGHALPLPGLRTGQVKVLRASYEGRTLRLEVEGMGGTQARFGVRRNGSGLRLTAEGGELAGDALVVSFPAGNGYEERVVTVRW
jgi:glycogen debranching enzyme